MPTYKAWKTATDMVYVQGQGLTSGELNDDVMA